MTERWVSNLCQNGYRSSSMDWLMKVFQKIEMLPVLLKNYLWSREQKWYRVNITFLLTSRKNKNCDICLRTKIYKGSVQKTYWYRVVPQCRKFWWFDYSRSQKFLSEGCESRHNHRYAVVVQDFGYSMDPVVSVQNKNFSGNPEGPQKYVLAVFMTRDVEGLGSMKDEDQSDVVHHFLNCTASLAIPRLLADTVLTRLQKKNFSGNTAELAEVLGADHETISHLHCHSFGIDKACEELIWNHCASTKHVF